MKNDKPYYFDYAAATPVGEEVAEIVKRSLMDDFFNPSSPYLAARAVNSQIAQARSDVAQILGAKTSEIIFTAGATEANNLALRGIAAKYPKSEMIISSIEHASVYETAELLAKGAIELKICPVKASGELDMTKLKQLISKKTVLLSIIHSNNEIGTIQPLKKIAELLREVRKRRAKQGNELPIYLHTDAAQSGNYLDLHFKRLGVDMATVNSAKVYGPKQTGALFINSGVEIEALITGGGQERGLRAGTENAANIIAFAAALAKAQKTKDSESARLTSLRKVFIDSLNSRGLDYLINGTSKHQLPNVLNLSFPGFDGEQLVMLLDEMGFAVATGAACSEDRTGPSRVLLALARSAREATGSLRISMGRTTSEEAVKALSGAIDEVLKVARRINQPS